MNGCVDVIIDDQVKGIFVCLGWKVFFNDGYTLNGINEINLDSVFHTQNPQRRGDRW